MDKKVAVSMVVGIILVVLTSAVYGQVSQNPGQPIKLTMVQTSRSLSFAPIYVSLLKGYFKDEGIDLNFMEVQGGGIASAALVSGDAQASAGAANDLVNAVSKGMDFVGVAGIANGMTMNVAVTKKFAEANRLNPKAPVSEKAKGLKGAQIGLSALGGAPDLYTRYILKTYGGLDPDKDNTMGVVGNAEQRRAALMQGHVDCFMGGIPDAEMTEHEGYGLVYMVPTQEVPEFKDFIHEVLIVRKGFVDKNPLLVQKLARAIARGSNFLIKHPEDAEKILQKQFGSVPSQVMSRALGSVRYAFGGDAKMSKAKWDNVMKVLMGVGRMQKPFATEEGSWWTNKYLVNIPVE